MGNFKIRIFIFIVALFLVTVFVVSSKDANSKNTFNIEQFENAMKGKGYNFEIKDASQDFLPTTRKRMIIDDKVVEIYIFGDDNKMEKEASRIGSHGSSYSNGLKSIHVSWVSFPHFYKKGSLIVQYVGDDEKIISDLTDIFGEQFAGYTP